MSKVIIIKNLDGTCYITRPAPNMFITDLNDIRSRTRVELAEKKILKLDATDAEVLEWVRNDVTSKYPNSSSRITDDSNLPNKNSSVDIFRNAWTDDNPTETVDVEITRAHQIKKTHFRALRKPILEKLDVESMKAVEDNNTALVNAISTKKQELRDVTLLTLPDDIEQLRSFKPSCLDY